MGDLRAVVEQRRVGPQGRTRYRLHLVEHHQRRRRQLPRHERAQPTQDLREHVRRLQRHTSRRLPIDTDRPRHTRANWRSAHVLRHDRCPTSNTERRPRLLLPSARSHRSSPALDVHRRTRLLRDNSPRARALDGPRRPTQPSRARVSGSRRRRDLTTPPTSPTGSTSYERPSDAAQRRRQSPSRDRLPRNPRRTQRTSRRRYRRRLTQAATDKAGRAEQPSACPQESAARSRLMRHPQFLLSHRAKPRRVTSSWKRERNARPTRLPGGSRPARQACVRARLRASRRAKKFGELPSAVTRRAIQ